MFERFSFFKSPAFHFSAADLEKRGRSAFVMLAIAAITYGSVGIFYDVVSIMMLRSRVVKPTAAVAAPLGPAAKQPADYYALIAQRNLFGTTDKVYGEKTAAQQQQQQQQQGPELTQLIDVRGTVAGTGKDGFAVIEEKGKNKQLLYKVGNTVAGARVVSISRNSVTFLYSGRETVIKITASPAGTLSPVRPVAQTPPPSAPATAGGSPMVISRAEIDASLRDMGTMLSQAQVRPYYTNGVPDGFIIHNIRPGSIYQKVGIREGDIIQGADDRRLVTADDVTAFYNMMRAGSSMTLKIKRAGQQLSIPYVFR